MFVLKGYLYHTYIIYDTRGIPSCGPSLGSRSWPTSTMRLDRVFSLLKWIPLHGNLSSLFPYWRKRICFPAMEVSVIEGECCWLRSVQSQRCIFKSFGVHSYMTRDFDFSILDPLPCWILALFILPSVVPFWSWLKYSASFINLYFYYLAPLVVSCRLVQAVEAVDPWVFLGLEAGGKSDGFFGSWWEKLGGKRFFSFPKWQMYPLPKVGTYLLGMELHPNSNPEYLKLNDIFDWESWELQIQIQMAERLSKLKLFVWRFPPSQIKLGKRLGYVSKRCDPLRTGGLQEPAPSKATRQGILHPRKRVFGKTYIDLEKVVSEFKGYGHMFFPLPDWISLWTEDGFCQAPGGLGRGTTSTWWVEWGRWEILTFFCLLCSLCVYIYMYNVIIYT